MKIYFQKIIKFNFFVFLILLSYSCDAGGNGVNILYMFDTSGSFYKNALPACLSLSTEIFSELKNDNSGLGIYPQFHQVVTIDEQSVDIGKNCGVKVEQSNIFKKETMNQNQTLDNCLELVKGDNYSIDTDLVGALLNASKAFESGGFYGNGLIIFSDLHEDVPDIKKYNFDLSGVSVFIIHEFSKEQLQNPEIFQNDKKRIKNLLLNSGCNEKDILFRNLSSVITSPNEVVSFFRQSFRDNR